MISVSFSFKLRKQLPQLATCALQDAPNLFLRFAGKVADLLITHLLQIPKHDRQPVTLRQMVNGLLNANEPLAFLTRPARSVVRIFN